MSEYEDRNAWDLEPHYSKHVSAMTGEGYHGKAAIAAELAHRDNETERLQARVGVLDADNRDCEERNNRLRLINAEQVEMIERLTAEVETYKGRAEVWEDAARACQKRAERLQARVERLEAELQRIATKRGSYRYQAHNCDHRAALDSCIDIAKRALTETD